MKRLIEIQSQEDYEELQEILEKLKEGEVVVTTQQAFETKSGNHNYVVVRQKVIEAKAAFRVNDDYFYIILKQAGVQGKAEVKSQFENMLQRGTSCFKSNKPNDYLLTIDVVCNELDMNSVYAISAIQPIFMSGEFDNEMTIVFPVDSIRFGKEELSNDEVDYEIQNREASEDEIFNNLNINEDFDSDEDGDGKAKFEFDENEFTNNDKYFDLDNLPKH